MRQYRVYFIIIFFITQSVWAQNCFKDVVLQVDTLKYSQQKDLMNYKGDKFIAFEYTSENMPCEVRLYPTSMDNIQKIDIANSSDFEILDSVFRGQDYFRFKIQFKNLNQSKFISLNLTINQIPLKETTCEIKLLPYHHTKADFYPKDDELYIGEERVFELMSNNPENIRVNPIFTEGKDINYRTEYSNRQLRLYLLPSKLGDMEFNLELFTINPYVDDKGKVHYQLPTIKKKFRVKGSRLAFLNAEQRDITLDDKAQRAGIEFQIDYTRLLEMEKTYRIENQEKAGGMLVAEIFTQKLLSNGKILCLLRPYSFHKRTDGYLYIKNGDNPVCITNFNVNPKTIIGNITILHEGNKRETVFYPGETVELRLEGLALDKAKFRFEGLNVLTSDSLIRTESVQTFKLQVPLNITLKEIEIYNRSEKVGRSIPVNEYQRPHQLNFVNINYGAGKTLVTDLPQTVLYPHVIRDIEISFNPEKIDDNNKLFGKQYVSVDVTVFNAKGDLVEIKRINNILVCPADNSPRAAFYIDKQCNRTPLSLNTILGRKTYDLDGWSKIEIVFSHDKDKYGGDGFVKKVELILQRKTRFDTEVSFPGGLLIKRADQANFNPFGGISLAIVQQLSFYHPEKINRYRPYKVGIGILANNAFNFSANASNRDVGVVVIGSLYPTRKDVKLSFPLYAGMGYFLSAKAWFFLIGPGIFVSF